MASSEQLNSEMTKMISSFNKQREKGFITSPAGQNAQTIRDLQHKVVTNEETLSTAPKKLLDAQRLLSSYDSSYRGTFDSNVNTMADDQINKLQNKFDIAKSSIIQNLDLYDTQIDFKNSMHETNEYQEQKLYNVNKDVAQRAGGIAVNHRLATFYSKNVTMLGLSISYMQIIYWTLFLIQVIATIMLFRKKTAHRNYILLGLVMLAIFPLYNTLHPILQKFITVLTLFPAP
jgi:hypothetical protein